MNIVEPAKMHPGGSLTALIYDSTSKKLCPASVSGDGMVMIECELDEDEQERLFMGGRLQVWLQLPPALLINGTLPITVRAIEQPE